MYNYYITNYKVNSLEIITKLKEERNLKLRKQFLEDKFAKKRYEIPNSNNSKSKLEINLKSLNVPDDYKKYINYEELKDNININLLLANCFSSNNSDLFKLGLYYARNILAKVELNTKVLEIIKELLDNGIVNNLIQFIEYSNDNVFIVSKYINMVII